MDQVNSVTLEEKRTSKSAFIMDDHGMFQVIHRECKTHRTIP